MSVIVTGRGRETEQNKGRDHSGAVLSGWPALSVAGGKPVHVTPPGGIGRNVLRLKSAAEIINEYAEHNSMHATKQRTCLEHLIPPPIHIDRSATRELQREEDNHHRNDCSAVQCGAEHVVELAPPRKIALADEVLEYEADREPRRIVDSRRRRDRRHAVEDDRGAHVARPRVRVPPLPQEEWHRQERTDDDRVEVRMVQRAGSKLFRRPYEAPDRGCGEEHLVVRARQLRLLVRITDIRHVVEYPFFDTDLDESRKDSRHHLHCGVHCSATFNFRANGVHTNERRARRYLDVVPELEVLHERRRRGERLYRVSLKEHVRKRLTGQQCARDDLCQDVDRNLSSNQHYFIEKEIKSHSHPGPSWHR